MALSASASDSAAVAGSGWFTSPSGSGALSLEAWPKRAGKSILPVLRMIRAASELACGSGLTPLSSAAVSPFRRRTPLRAASMSGRNSLSGPPSSAERSKCSSATSGSRKSRR